MTADKQGDVDIVDKERVYQGYFVIDRYRLRHRTFAGGWTEPVMREVFERGHAVAVLLYDPDRDEVCLIEQFRIGALTAGWNPWLIEVVAGIIEDGESIEEVCRREVAEEAGCAITELVPIANVIVSPGACSETVALYCARVDATKVGGIHGLVSEGEDIRVFTVKTDEAVAMVKDGRINNSVAMISMLWLAGERQNLQRRWR